MSKEKFISLLQEAKVLNEGHFLLTSGKHSDKYLQCVRIFQTPKYAAAFCGELAEKFKNDGIELVIGPAVGAVQMAFEVSRILNVDNCFTERVEGKFELRRGFKIETGVRCLLVEDVITTGGTILEVKDLVEREGGIVAGIGSIIDRSGGKFNPGTRFESAVKIEANAYQAQDCPLCRENKIELVKPGSRNLK